MITRYFRNANLLLCVFHVLKYLMSKIYKEEISKEGKEAIWRHIHPIVYASSVVEFESALETLREVCGQYQPEQSVPIDSNTNTNITTFAQYFMKN